MNEPLNTSLTSVNFSGKSYTSNPLYNNQPLRLTREQTSNPESVLEDFFQTYHLCDVRAIMWQWVTEVLCSPHESSNDSHERNNDIFFYEKIESLVEAAWIMRRENNQKTKQASEIPSQPICTAGINTPKVTLTPRFSKPPRLIEKATSQPAEVIYEVFDQVPLSDLTEYLLPNWLRVALINTQSPYSSGNAREVLYEFYELLILFLEALHGMLKSEQLNNLSTTITDFFRKFTIDYLRRELADFLEAGIGHDGQYPHGFSPWQAWMTYNHILCLIEAAYRLSIDQQKQAVLDAHASLMQELEKSGISDTRPAIISNNRTTRIFLSVE